jgi:adhesin transport system membrane fusion protein
MSPPPSLEATAQEPGDAPVPDGSAAAPMVRGRRWMASVRQRLPGHRPAASAPAAATRPAAAKPARRWFGLLRPRGPSDDADRAYMDELRAAQLVEATPRANAVLWLMAAVLVAGLAWATLTRVDVVSRSQARVIADGREQVIASLEGGLLAQLFVREGAAVSRGQPLAQIDPTRFEAQQAETDARRLALKGSLARLRAEASGRELRFPDDVRVVPRIVEAETESFEARRRSLGEAVATNRRSIALLGQELDVAQSMAAKGLMSEVEVMRLRRQVNDLQLQSQERINRFRQEATTELVRVQTELSQLEEQLAGRADVLRRTVLTSPVDGMVKVIKAVTLGGVIAPGAPVMEVVPVGGRVLVEARVSPSEIGFVRIGQRAEIKLSAYDYTTYGGLTGRVEYISPDVLGDPDRAGGVDATWYRVLVRAEDSKLVSRGKELPVIPGMSGTVEIRTHERSVLSFLLRPMLKSKEAFRES